MPKDKKDGRVKKDKKDKKVKADVAPEPTPAAAEEPVASTSSSSPAPEASAPATSMVVVDDDAEDAVSPPAAEAGPTKVQVDDGSLLEIDPDAPAPLSRAALRKAKSNPALASGAAGSTSTSTTAKGKESDAAAAAAAAKPGKYSVWVGNLAFKTTEAELRGFLKPALTLSAPRAGKAKDADADDDDDESSSSSSSSDDDEEDEEKEEGAAPAPKKARPEPTITRVNLPRSKAVGGRPGVNKGFAYVDFSNWASQQAAVKLSEGHLHGRALLIKAGGDFSNRPEAPKAALASLPEGQTKSKTAQALLAKQRNPVGCTLFVGNLGFEATEEAMRELIDAHWKTSLANNKRHAQKAVRSSFLPESETTAGDEAAPKAEGGEAAGDAAEADKAPVNPAELLVGFAAGLRKVRMAQFQDSGKCKGFAFLDFFTPAQATAALVDMRNHRLDGRSLKMEYASPSAAARSGTGSHSFNAPIASYDGGADDAAAAPAEGTSSRPGPTPRTTRKVRPMKAERAAAKLAAAVAAGTATPEEVAASAAATAALAAGGERKRSNPDGGAGGERQRPAKLAKWEQSGRQAPGAALAMAKRENVGIVESKGTKVVFD